MGLVISILLLIFLANTFTDYRHLHQYAMALLCGLGILAEDEAIALLAVKYKVRLGAR